VVAEGISAATGLTTELVPVTTIGDRDQTVPLHVIGGLGVFVKEVQQAVLDGRADMAVHSAKDMPSETPAGLVIGAFCERRDCADALIGRTLADLPHGATVATGSVRRRAQLNAVRPDLQFVELRGNIAKRLDRVPPSGAVVMAVAALEVLDLTERIAERLEPGVLLPQVGQGALAVECRVDDAATIGRLATIDDSPAHTAVTAERAFLAELGSGCSLPVGGHVLDGRLHAFLASSDQAGATVFAEAVELTGGRGDFDIARAVARRARRAVGW